MLPAATSRRWLLAAALGLALAVLVVRPLIELAVVAAEQIPFDEDAIGMAVVGNTVQVGLYTAVAATALGVGAAVLTERLVVAGRRWLRLAILLPLLVPPFVAALSWVRAYGPGGLLADTTGVGFSAVFGLIGIVLVIAVNALPLSYLVTVAALNTRARHELELAARASGASPPTMLRTITLPLLLPAIVGSAALVFVLAINSFGVPAVLGTPASFDVVTTQIYESLALSARPEAFSRAVLLAFGLVVAALLFAAGAESLLSRNEPGASPAAQTLPFGRSGRTRGWLAGLAWIVVLATTLLPLVALTLVAITTGVGVAPTPSNWTLQHVREALDPRLLAAFGRSLGLAAAAATVAVALGGAVAAIRTGRLSRLAGVLVLLTFAVPGSTLAVAMLLSYGPRLRDTLLLILLAYIAKLWAIGHRSIAASAGNLSRDVYFAARSSGANAATTLRTVVVPLLRPSLVGGWLLVFVIAFHELTMSSLLYGPGTDTLAVAILNLQQLGDVPVSSALAVLLTMPLLAVAVPVLVVGRLPRRLLGTG